MIKVFIDGKEGTTGLRIYDRINTLKGIELITLPEELRKDASARKEAINSSDITFLCLPDTAAKESVSLVENENVRIIDTSTAHRTAADWVYGLPELSEEHFRGIQNGKRIAVPGCHASGFIALVYPLIKNGILPSDSLLCCHSLTGYSGGGKKMIAEYESEDKGDLLYAPRQYGLTQCHKHLPEMTKVCGLENTPIFSPIVDDFYSGMEMTVPLFASQLNGGYRIDDIKSLYSSIYDSPCVRYAESNDNMLSAATMSGKDSMRISVFGNEERIILTAVYDNLGKGASGAAIECMNIMLGRNPYDGLII